MQTAWAPGEAAPRSRGPARASSFGLGGFFAFFFLGFSSHGKARPNSDEEPPWVKSGGRIVPYGLFERWFAPQGFRLSISKFSKSGKGLALENRVAI